MGRNREAGSGSAREGASRAVPRKGARPDALLEYVGGRIIGIRIVTSMLFWRCRLRHDACRPDSLIRDHIARGCDNIRRNGAP